jgi:hypothetical protein
MPLAAYLLNDSDCCLLSVRWTVEMAADVSMVHVSAFVFCVIIAPIDGAEVSISHASFHLMSVLFFSEVYATLYFAVHFFNIFL